MTWKDNAQGHTFGPPLFEPNESYRLTNFIYEAREGSSRHDGQKYMQLLEKMMAAGL